MDQRGTDMRTEITTALRRAGYCVTLAAMTAMPMTALPMTALPMTALAAPPTDEDPVQRRGCVAVQVGKPLPVGQLTRCTVVTATRAGTAQISN
jgi:hypothetical protein